jgi:hypothetical protein
VLPAAVIAAASIATLAAFTAGLTLWRTPRKPPEAVMPRDRPPVVTSAARLVSDEAPAPSVPSVASSPTPASPRVESRPEVLYLPAVATTPAPPAISTADRMRDEGERTLESDLRALSDGALDAEAAWNAYRGACVGRSTQMLATEGAWAGKVVRVPMEDTARCRSRRAAVDELVRPTRTRLHEAEEAARRAGVLPGRVRDLKLRYRVDSALWE